MTTARDILDHIDDIPDYSDEFEKYHIIASKRASIDVENYIFSTLENLQIEITKNKVEKAHDLVYSGKLDGRCWETTEAMAVFFDTAYVVRGYFYLDGKKYYHAWLEILYDGVLYVFDPTSNVICLKKDFDEVFKPYMQSLISSRIIRKELIQVLNSKGKNYSPNFDSETNEEVKKFGELLSSWGKDFGKSVPYSNDLSSCFYRNTSSYVGEIENNKIKSLKVHFYDNVA